MHFDQPSRQGEADAKTALRSIAIVTHLREEVEDPRQHFRSDADTVVGDGDFGLGAARRGANMYPAAAFSVFRGVVQQVGKRLAEPRRIRVGPQRLLRQVQHQRVTMGVDHRPRVLGRTVNHRSKVDSVGAQVDLVLRDARHVQQIVGDPHQLQQLPLGGGAGFLDDDRVVMAMRISSMALRIGASGLRSSCDSVARNSSLRRSASRSTRSASFRWVRSTSTLTQP